MTPQTPMSEQPTVFKPDQHLRNFDSVEWEPMYGEDVQLWGIRGKTGATEIGSDGELIGADLIEMQPGSAFPLHTHPGDHILYGISGRGTVTIDGELRPVEVGTTVYIAGGYPHNVGTYADATEPFVLLAVGHPKVPVASPERMQVVQDEE